MSKLLKDSIESKLVTRKSVELNDWSNNQYSTSKNRTFQAPILRSNLCDYRAAYIVVKEKKAVSGTNNDIIKKQEANLWEKSSI